MIKIRYADLPQGLHVQVRTGGRRPVIYLLPGLSPAQGRDALRRLVRTSRQGYGPRLRASGVAFRGGQGRDEVRRAHRAGRGPGRPTGSAVLAAFLTAAVVCYSLFVTVTVRLGPRPAATGPRGASPTGAAGSGASGSALSGSALSGAVPSGSVPSGSGPSGRAASPGPVPTGTWSAPGGVLTSVPAGASPGPSSAPSPSAAPPPASPGPYPPPPGHPGGLCLQMGPLGVCISG